ncbi:amino acid racemase [bacterium]|nr:amino acid racemase [bacterium]
MKTVGIIGGIGPESTVDYYKSIIAVYREQKRDGSYPSIIINSIDVNRMLQMAAANELPKLVEYLANEIERLERAGADFGIMAANTPHIVFDEICKKVALPLISIVEAACDFASSVGLQKLGLFGTRFTMEGEFYATIFRKRQMALVVPDKNERDFIHDKYMNELLKGMFFPETRSQLLKIAGRMLEREQIQGLILAGTELPLILDNQAGAQVPLLDTTRIHVNAVVQKLLY